MIHWQVVRALQEFYARHEGDTINVRELHDALDEHFHEAGGIKYLYQLFPKGPGSRLPTRRPASACRGAGQGYRQRGLMQPGTREAKSPLMLQQ